MVMILWFIQTFEFQNLVQPCSAVWNSIFEVSTTDPATTNRFKASVPNCIATVIDLGDVPTSDME